MQTQDKLIKQISDKLQIAPKQALGAITLLDQGSTIPFISRYRKEATGGLDEVQIANIKDEIEKFKTLQARKETILKSISDQEKLTDELQKAIENCDDITLLEDIYLPYKPKRSTKASIAREKGLEPLAKKIMVQQDYINLDSAAAQFINSKVADENEALQGARDIIAEWINESQAARNTVRRSFQYNAQINTKLVKGKEQEAEKYKDYFTFGGRLDRQPSHRLLAIRRAEAEGFLKVSITTDNEDCLDRLSRIFIKSKNDSSKQVEIALKDSYKRLLTPSIETEFAAISKETADTQAINIFVDNLKQLLLAPPLGRMRVLGIDPGFRTGCKLVCINEQGDLLHNENIYPHPPQGESSKASRTIQKLVETYKIDAIAIGNGTASRETENFISKTALPKDIKVFVVSENGASIYSASAVAREEFGEYDVTVRGAVSIARRLADPLAELVKIDPKSIGVGQYQHDVNQTQLKKSLDQTVENVVCQVGVDVNTASKHLLTYVAGLGAVLAKNIVEYRTENGAFKSKKDLMKVPKMGAKTFEQAAGFLRVGGAENPLDNSAVHPESYAIVQKMAKDLKHTVLDLIQNADLRKQIDLEKYITTNVGLPTLKDILSELEKPGRDPRKPLKEFSFNENIHKIEDLEIGMNLPGIITNLTAFGAFVDIGIKENGLLHISQICDKFISNPSEVLNLHQQVMVKVIEIDIPRKRIALTMK